MRIAVTVKAAIQQYVFQILSHLYAVLFLPLALFVYFFLIDEAVISEVSDPLMNKNSYFLVA